MLRLYKMFGSDSTLCCPVSVSGELDIIFMGSLT